VSSTILNDIVRDYEAISTSWFSALGPIANKIFWILVAIQLTWSAIWWVLDREDGLAVVSSLLRQIVAIGFFYALLLNGGTWIPAVIQSFSQAGATAAGLTDLSPTGVFDQGLALANKILNATSDLGLLDGFFASLIAGITAIVVVIAFAGITANARLYQLLVRLGGSIMVARRVLFAWLAVNLLLGSQISWILRPFIGSPGLPVQFLRPDAFHGSFFETVLYAMRRVFHGF